MKFVYTPANRMQGYKSRFMIWVGHSVVSGDCSGAMDRYERKVPHLQFDLPLPTGVRRLVIESTSCSYVFMGDLADRHLLGMIGDKRPQLQEAYAELSEIGGFTEEDMPLGNDSSALFGKVLNFHARLVAKLPRMRMAQFGGKKYPVMSA